MKTFINFIYTVLIGVAVAVFVGLGIWTFYSGPKSPTYPDYSQSYIAAPTEAQNQEYQAKQDKYNQEFKQFEKFEKPYSKKVAGIALATGVIFYVAGLWTMKRNEVVGEGLALGGTFTSIYAAVKAATGEFKQLVFASVTIILAMLILLALYRIRIQKSVKNPADTPR